MSRNWMQVGIAAVLLLALIITIILSLRSLSGLAPFPTADIQRVQTEAVAAYIGNLTSTALAEPTTTSTPTSEPATATVSTASLETPGGTTAASLSATPSCLRSHFVTDVTVPDYTVMTPAEVFTKTWRMQNNGTCPWQAGFQAILIGGVAMGGSPYVLTSTVNPGGQLDISIKMAAPTNETGLIQGTWQIVDQNGKPFGNIMTVKIVIGTGGGTVLPTVAASPTP